jgi:hypothetical protein
MCVLLYFRDLDEILPEEYSASYRRLVQQVFTDEDGVADYMTLNSTHKEGEKHQRHYAGLFALLTRVNMTRDAMDKDEDLLKLNLSAVGCILLEFTNALSKHMVRHTLFDFVHSFIYSVPLFFNNCFAVNSQPTIILLYYTFTC